MLALAHAAVLVALAPTVAPAPAVVDAAVRMTGRSDAAVVSDVSVQPSDYGYADISGGIIHLRGYLLAMLNDPERAQPYQAALAVLIFCHEARHVRGTQNERVAERWAVAHAYRAARLLGASEQWSRAMLRWIPYWNSRIAAA